MDILMDIILTFLFLLVISTALTFLLKYRFEQTIAITCFAVIITLYVFGLAGIMIAGFYAVIAASIVALGICIWGMVKGYKEKTNPLKDILTPGFAVFILISLFIFYVNRNRMMSLWDEFSHWGVVVKNMFVFDAFGNHPDATTTFRGYPPATALFHYFWMKIGGFSEPKLYMSMGLLGVSLLLPVFKNIRWDNLKVIPFVAIFVFIIPLFPHVGFYNEIYVDALLGILLAYILFAYFTEKNYDTAFYINIALASAVLTLVKASGFGLALIAGIIIVLDVLIKSRKEKLSKDRLAGFLKSKYFLVSAIALLIPVIVNQSWSIYRNLTDTAFAWTPVSGITLPAFLELLKGNAEEYQYTIIVNFVSMLLSGASSFGFTFFQCLIIISGLLFIWMLKSEQPLRNKIINCSAGVYIGWALYTVSLLVLYVFAWYDQEALALASFHRYMNTYFATIVCLFCCMFIYYINENEKLSKNRKFARIVLFMLIPLYLFDAGIVYRQVFSDHTAGWRDAVTIKSVSAYPFDIKTDRIHYIHQNSTSLELFIARYDITPVNVGEYSFTSLGTPYGAGDVYTKNITVDEWLEILQNEYTYVYLNKIDEQFISEFGDAFEDPGRIQNMSLFRVTELNGRVILVYVEV